jgi:hypothetical protein
MAQFMRINGYFGNFTADSFLKSTNDLKMFRLTLRSTSTGTNTAIDLRTQDGNAAPTSSTTRADELVEMVCKELNPLMYQTDNAALGVMFVLTHGHNVNEDQIKTRIVGIKGTAGNTTIGSDSLVQQVTGLTTVTV